MNNRIMAALMALVLCLCLFISVGPVEAEAATACKHVYSTVKQDSTTHWYACSNCGEAWTGSGEEHTYVKKDLGNGKHIDTCTVCGKTKGSASNHSLDKIPNADGTHTVKCKQCTYEVTENHTLDSNCKCTVCNEEYHTKGTELVTKAGDAYHWYSCTVCKKGLNAEQHSYQWTKTDKDHKMSCVCGAVNHGLEDHKFGDAVMNADGKTHTLKCETCHYEKTEDCSDGTTLNCTCTCNRKFEHDYEWTQWQDATKGHKKVCKTCGTVDESTNGAHDFEKTMTPEGHSYVCKDCDYEHPNTGAHVDKYKVDGSKGADCICDTCGYKIAHEYDGYTMCGDGKGHERKCVNCNGAGIDYELCELDYVAHTVHADHHSKACTKCLRNADTTTNFEGCEDADKDCICDKCNDPIDHKWDDTVRGYKYVGKKDATCEAAGNKEYEICGTCGQFFDYSGKILSATDVVVAATGHDYVWKKGEYNTQHFQKCKDCKQQTNLGDHVFEYTDNGNGTHHLLCKTCGYEGDVYCADIAGDGKCECVCGYAIPHKDALMVRTSKVDATCTTDGNYGYYTCVECKGTYEKLAQDSYKPYTNFVIEKLGHKWVSQEIVEGQHVSYCANKDCKVDKRYVAHEDTDGDCLCDIADKKGKLCGVLAHSHDLIEVEGVEATCLVEGREKCYKYEDCETYFADFNKKVKIDGPRTIAKTGHNYGDYLPEGEGHVKKCQVCGENESAVAAHVDQWGDNVCDDCGAPIGLVAVAKINATCAAAGQEAYFYSPITNIKYWDAEGTSEVEDDEDLVIEKLEHTIVVAPSADGKHHVLDCEKCDYTETQAHITEGTCVCLACGQAIDGHKTTFKAEVAAKCEKAGTYAHLACSCGKLYNTSLTEVKAKDLVIPALGHDWSDKWTEDNRQGDHYKVCDVCNKINRQDHVLEVEDPMKGNYHQFVCECGEVVTEIHKDGDNDGKCDVCKHAMSSADVDVKQHDQVTITTGNPDTTKSFWTVIKNYLFGETPSNAGGATVSNSNPQAQPDKAPSNPNIQEDAVQEENRTPDVTPDIDDDADQGGAQGGNNNAPGNNTQDTSFGAFLNELFGQITQMIYGMYNSWLGR